MNKAMISVAAAVAGLLIYLGLGLHAKTLELLKQKDQTIQQNLSLSQEIRQKQLLKRMDPQSLPEAFAFFINQCKLFETDNGIRMKPAFGDAEQQQGIESRYVATEFRNVRGLPLTVNAAQFSDQAQALEALNDIHVLAGRTDFKISEIAAQNGVLTVKGEVYGT